jgi:hypothetical protein
MDSSKCPWGLYSWFCSFSEIWKKILYYFCISWFIFFTLIYSYNFSNCTVYLISFILVFSDKKSHFFAYFLFTKKSQYFSFFLFPKIFHTKNFFCHFYKAGYKTGEIYFPPKKLPKNFSQFFSQCLLSIFFFTDSSRKNKTEN